MPHLLPFIKTLSAHEKGYFLSNCSRPNTAYIKLFKILLEEGKIDATVFKKKMNALGSPAKRSKLKQHLWDELVRVLGHYHLADTPFHFNNSQLQAISLLEKKHLLQYGKGLIVKMLRYTRHHELFPEHLMGLQKMFAYHSLNWTFDEAFWDDYKETSDAIAVMTLLREASYHVFETKLIIDKKKQEKTTEEIEALLTEIRAKMTVIKRYARLEAMYYSLMAFYYELQIIPEKAVEQLASVIQVIEAKPHLKAHIYPLGTTYINLCTKMLNYSLPSPTIERIAILKTDIASLPDSDSNAVAANLLIEALYMFVNNDFSTLEAWEQRFSTSAFYLRNEGKIHLHLYAGSAYMRVKNYPKALEHFYLLEQEAKAQKKVRLEQYVATQALLIHYELSNFSLIKSKLAQFNRVEKIPLIRGHELIIKTLKKAITANADKKKVWQNFLATFEALPEDDKFFNAVFFDIRDWAREVTEQ